MQKGQTASGARYGERDHYAARAPRSDRSGDDQARTALDPPRLSDADVAALLEGSPSAPPSGNTPPRAHRVWIALLLGSTFVAGALAAFIVLLLMRLA